MALIVILNMSNMPFLMVSTRPVIFLLYIFDIYRAIGCNALQLFVYDASNNIANMDLQFDKKLLIFLT